MDDRGQSALFDAFLFLVVATVASSAVLAYAYLSFERSEVVSRDEALAYAEDVRVTLMRTTLEDPWYLNATGERVDLGQGVTIERFVLEEVRLIAGGLQAGNFEETNTAIRRVADSLVRPPFAIGTSGVLEGDGSSVSLWIGHGTGPPADHFTAQWGYVTADGAVATIAVLIWYT